MVYTFSQKITQFTVKNALKLETQQQAQSIFESYGIKKGDLDIKRQFTRQLDEIFTS